MYAQCNSSVKASRSQALSTALMAGNGTTVNIYTGSYPATPDTAVPAASILLVTLAYTGTTFCSSTAGVISVNASSPADAAESGTPGWARVLDGTGNAVADFDCGTNGAAITLSEATVSKGNQYQITGGTIAEG